MPTLNVLETDLIKKLQPAAPATRASYSRMRRPWTPGYRAIAQADDATKLAGFNSYHPGENTLHTCSLQGAGAAAGASAPLYTLPTGATLVLPVTADITDAADYLDAVCVIYAPDDRDNAVLVPRVEFGGSDLTAQFWRVESATTFSLAYSYAAGPLYSDIPRGWTIELQVPAAADIQDLWDPAAADTTIVKLTDFMAAGVVGTSDGNILLNRVFR